MYIVYPEQSPGQLGRMPDKRTIDSLRLSVIGGDGSDRSGSSTGLSVGVGQSARVGERLESGEEETEQPFDLSDGLPTIPTRLVKKIFQGEFGDMSKFLKDNLEAEHCYAGSVGTSTQSQGGQRRAVPDLLSWILCFGTYISVVASRYPEKVRQLLAYQTLIIREARRLGGKGWLAYDTMFRQQAATSNTVDWSQLISTLYAVTYLAQQGNRTRSRTIERMSVLSGQMTTQCR